ncbi:MAG: hypothetical protein KAJ98_03945 [Spirochaetaceae bacterium]|nr:hypothetical protein [Spirochaetaceae bacterium]
MKKIVFIVILAVFAVSLWGQSNDLLDRFLDGEEADVATTLLLVAQASGNLPMDAGPDDGYAWGLEQDFAKHVSKTAPGDPVSLGLFYLALFKSYGVKGGGMYTAVGSPRYAALEAGFLGYVEPSSLYHTRSVPPYEVLTGITYVTEDAEGGEM